MNEQVCNSTTERGHCDDVRQAFIAPETTVSNALHSGVTDKKSDSCTKTDAPDQWVWRYENLRNYPGPYEDRG